MRWAISNEVDLATQNAPAGTLAKQDLQETPFFAGSGSTRLPLPALLFSWVDAHRLS
jgi:hypothetical protein